MIDPTAGSAAPDYYFRKFSEVLLRERNLDLGLYSFAYVNRRIHFRLGQRGLPENGLKEYLEILRAEPKEFDRFLEALSINVTEFFRDAPLWKELEEKTFPALIRRKAADPIPAISVWSCGCSTGEEPYSIAMLFDELLPAPRRLAVSILATDIDKDALARAQAGNIPEEPLKTLSARYILKHFKLGPTRATFSISDKLRQSISFRHHNLQSPAPAGPFDVIFCRNVIIYLTPQMKEELITKFHQALRPGGILILGKCELLSDSVRFSSPAPSERIYVKT